MMPIWLTVVLACGGTTLINLIVTFIFTKVVNSYDRKKKDAELVAEEIEKKNEVLKRGVQALLRHELYELYDIYYQEKGYAPLDIKNDFEFIYLGYHNLGKNGVMDGIHERFMKLPDEPKEEKSKKTKVSRVENNYGI